MNVLATDIGLWVMGSGKLDIRGRATRRVEPEGHGSDVAEHPRDPDHAVRTWRLHDVREVPGSHSHLAGRPRHGQGSRRPGVHAGGVQPHAQRSDRGHEGRSSAHLHPVVRTTIDQVRGDPLHGSASGRRCPTATTSSSVGTACTSTCAARVPGFAVVTGTVIRDCGSHAFVPHMSNGISFTDCIAYDVNEDAYWWDAPDQSNDVHYQHCMAAKLVPIPSLPGIHADGLQLGARLRTRGERLRRRRQPGEHVGEWVRVAREHQLELGSRLDDDELHRPQQQVGRHLHLAERPVAPHRVRLQLVPQPHRDRARRLRQHLSRRRPAHVRQRHGARDARSLPAVRRPSTSSRTATAASSTGSRS